MLMLGGVKLEGGSVYTHVFENCKVVFRALNRHSLASQPSSGYMHSYYRQRSYGVQLAPNILYATVVCWVR